MESMLTFISVLFIIFGVLQIVLFFKVWSMTNDVNRMKKHLLKEHADDDILKAIVSDNKELAKKLMIDSFVYELIEFSKNHYYKGYDTIDNLKEAHRLRFQKIGENLPDNVIIDPNQISSLI